MEVNNILPVNTFDRLAKQNGVKRLSRKACELLAKYCEDYAIDLIKKARELSEHSERATILERDIEAAKKLGDA